MTNPLVPQLRADKNGKLVTRHVNENKTSGSLSSALPAPALAVTKTEPEKSEKEIHKETYEALAKRLLESVDVTPDDSRLKNVGASLSWFNSALLANINSILDEKPSYRTQLASVGSITHLLTTGKGLHVGMTASVHDLATACVAVGLENIVSPDELARKFLRRPTYSLFIKDSNIKDFRAAYLAHVLELDEDEHADGKLDYYRHLERFSDKLDDVVHALPVLKTILEGEDSRYMLEEGIANVMEVVDHLSEFSDDEVLRVQSFIGERGDELNSYDTEIIDEMLKNTEASVGNGWL